MISTRASRVHASELKRSLRSPPNSHSFFSKQATPARSASSSTTPTSSTLARSASCSGEKREEREKRERENREGRRENCFWVVFSISALVFFVARRRAKLEARNQKVNSFSTPDLLLLLKTTKQRHQARRDLQPGRAVPRPGLVPAAAVHRRGFRSREYFVF